MQITVSVEDKNIAEKIVWFLSTLKDKGVEVIESESRFLESDDRNIQELQIDSMAKTWDNDFDKVWDEL